MKHCVLLSRHALQPSQRKSLAGFTVHQVHPPSRYWSAEDAVALAQSACGGKFPDLIIIVAPLGMLRRFLHLVGDRVPVVRSVMDFRCDPPRFVRWERVVDVQIVTHDWTPDGSEVRP